MKETSTGKRIRKHRFRPSLNQKANFSDLPEEILLDIIQHLYLPDLEALSIVCRRLRTVCAKDFHNEQEIDRHLFRDLALNSDWEEYEYGYHDFLLRVLKHEINPNYVKRFDCHKACSKDSRLRPQGEVLSVAQSIGWTPNDVQIVKAAINRSPWLRDFKSDELIARMLNGEDDPVLALMVPMLKNMSFFVPPAGAHTLMQVFVNIARLHIMSEIEDPGLWQRLPFHKLHTIYGAASWTTWATDIMLVGIVHYISLPSIKRIYLDGGCENQLPKFERAALRELKTKRIPRSRASVVFIRQGEMWRNLAELLIDHFEGPCVVRQYMDEHIPSEVEAQEDWVGHRLMEDRVLPKDPMSYYWDHCVVSSERDPVTKTWREESRNIEFEIKYRNFHEESDALNFDVVRYKSDMEQAGFAPSPEWIHLVRWHHFLIDPVLDSDPLTLE